jgi:predicted AAA+ superfamily ATPase
MENIKQRNSYIEKIKPFIDKPVIKVLTGIRRSGKSTIMLMLIQELKKMGVVETQIFHTKLNSLEYEGMTAKRTIKTIKKETCKRKNIFVA